MNLKDFNYREESVDLKEIFPQLDLEDFKDRFGGRKFEEPHQEIFQTVLDLWDGGFEEILERYGFYDEKYGQFSGHCHQITPALGVALMLKGFKVAYLEAFRASLKTGEMISPEEEKSEMREEFCSIGRIPYCCLEIEIEGEKFYVSGKHLVEVDGEPRALLTADCYREMVGVFAHQDNKGKSGIYLLPVKDKPFGWFKQKVSLETGKELEEAEYFQTFVYMKLEG